MREARHDVLELEYRPPLDWAFFLRYLAARAVPGVESVSGDAFERTLEIDGHRGSLRVACDSNRARLLVQWTGPSELPASAVAATVRQVFDLDADPEAVAKALSNDPRLRRLVAATPGIRIPGAWSLFEHLIRTIVGQQVTVSAARTILGRLVERVGTSLDVQGCGSEERYLFPGPAELQRGDLGGLGMPRRRLETLRSIATALDAGSLVLRRTSETGRIREDLLNLPGIGPWTVEYFALRALRDADAWPATDLILKRSLENLWPASTTCPSEGWRPYRGYAAMLLWKDAARARSTPRKPG